jgi:single-stranded-DNA-specific exonuclease
MRDALRADKAGLTASDVAFRLAPRINAAGRLDDPAIALEALLDGGPALARLEELNADRQRQTKLAVDGAVEKILARADVPPLLSVARPDLHPGVLGLVAAKLSERFGRPSLVVSERDGVCTASLRSAGGYHLAEGLTRCSDLLDRFGGHAQAAGCTFAVRNFEPLVERLGADVASSVPAEDLVPTLEIDGEIPLSSLRPTLISGLSVFQPFGAGNQEPRVIVRGATLDGARGVGENARHLQARIGGAKLIGFGLGHLATHADQRLDLVGRLGIDTWNGRETAQLFLEDARIAE